MSRFQPATTSYNQLYIPLLMLITTGTEDNFLDLELASHSGLPFELLNPTVTVYALDGRLLAQVTHHTSQLLLVLSGNHHNQVQPNFISLPCAPLVMGHSWLKKLPGIVR